MKQLMFAAAMVVTLGPPAAPAEEKAVYRIGISKGAVRDVPKDLLTTAGDSFQDLMKSQTGLDGKATLDREWAKVAQDLNDGALELGILQGHEYAWAKQKYPDLQPFVCSIARPKPVTAYLLVLHDSKAASLADLKAGKLVLAGAMKDHARLFLAKRQADEMAGAAFKSTATAANAHEAIQAVIDGEADLTATDHAAWNTFQKLYPGASQNVKVLAESPEFPPTVLVYKTGGVDDAALKKLRDGLLTAHDVPKAARLMKTVRIEKFGALPAEFDATVAASLKAYPPPKAEK